MRLPPLRFFANAYIAAYLLDAGLSITDEVLRSVWDWALLVPLRNLVAYGVLAGSCLMLPCLLVTPRLPRSVLLPYSLSALWFAFGAAPLGLLAESWAAELATAIQAVLAIAGSLRIRHLNGGRGWLLRQEALNGPVFSWRYSLGACAATALLLPPVAAAYLGLLVVTFAQQASGGFLGFDTKGIWTSERLYARGDREILLIGMMHFGERDAYRKLVSSFHSGSTLVLEEGVSDDVGLLEQPLSYGMAADRLGLEAQQPLATYLEPIPAVGAKPAGDRPVAARGDDDAGMTEGAAADVPSLIFRNADLDISDFAPETVDWLEQAAELWSSNDPLVFLQRMLSQASAQSHVLVVVIEDVLVRRNAYLLAEIEGSLPDHSRVVVPWGALHLPEVEEAILGWDFELVRERQHHLLSWRTIAMTVSAVQSRVQPPDPEPDW